MNIVRTKIMIIIVITESKMLVTQANALVTEAEPNSNNVVAESPTQT